MDFELKWYCMILLVFIFSHFIALDIWYMAIRNIDKLSSNDYIIASMYIYIDIIRRPILACISNNN